MPPKSNRQPEVPERYDYETEVKWFPIRLILAKQNTDQEFFAPLSKYFWKEFFEFLFNSADAIALLYPYFAERRATYISITADNPTDRAVVNVETKPLNDWDSSTEGELVKMSKLTDKPFDDVLWYLTIDPRVGELPKKAFYYAVSDGNTIRGGISGMELLAILGRTWNQLVNLSEIFIVYDQNNDVQISFVDSTNDLIAVSQNKQLAQDIKRNINTNVPTNRQVPLPRSAVSVLDIEDDDD